MKCVCVCVYLDEGVVEVDEVCVCVCTLMKAS
jgi:hypothetical protein